jgi:hypothetical protein
MKFVEPHMLEELKDHILVPLESGPHVKAFYLKRPNEGRMMSTLILFTPEGIVIQGDLAPSRNGNISNMGYGLNWFRGELGGEYLCEKFLERKFVSQYASEEIRREILRQRYEREIDFEKARDLWDIADMPDDFTGPVIAYDFWTQDLSQEGSDCPGYGFEPREAGWLCAIQQKFAELYQAMIVTDGQS